MTNTEAIEAMKAQDVTDTNVGDMISRQAAIDTLKNHLKTTDVPASYPGIIRAFEEWIEEVPSAQPEKRTEERTETHACVLISRQAAIDYCYALINAENPSDPGDEWNYSQERINQTEVILHHLEVMPSAQPYERCIAEIKMGKDDLEELVAEKVEEIKKNMPAQPLITEPHWIPCSERLPEDDVEVLISYRYKEGEGDTSHTDIDITTYGQMYFGGNKVGNYKHWRAPFEYFESNYEVIAWMPLPESYQSKERKTDEQ